MFLIGCGSAWNGRIVHLEDGKLVIQPEGDGEIKSGQKVLIYREKTITHPITGEVLGTIKDNIVMVPVLWVGNQTTIAEIGEPWFEMMMVDDRAIAVRGSVKPLTGSVHEIGKISNVDDNAKSVRIATKETIRSGEALSVIKYTGTVRDPDTDKVLAVAVEPVANLRVVKINGQLQASYDLIDKILGWIEIGDVVARRTGDMLSESRWFQDPPGGFSENWIFNRNYLRAIRYYDSGQYRETVLELNSVIQMDPEYEDAEYLLGLCYSNLNRYEESVARFRNLLNRKQDDARVWAALAYVYLKQENLQESAKSYEELAHLLPGDPKVWTDLGDIYRRLGDHQKAEQAYRKALEIDRNDEDAAYELHISQGDKRE